MRRVHSRSRGFTLIELVVALGMASVVILSAVTIFLAARRTAVESGVRAQLGRAGQLAVDVMKRDFAFAGAGAPPRAAACVDNACSGDVIGAVFRNGDATGLAFLGDQPYPNAELNGIAAISRLENEVPGDTSSDAVSITAEPSGACTPHASVTGASFRCLTSRTTPLFGVVAGDDCRGGNEAASTCPWAQNKMLRTSVNHLIVVDAEGRWYTREWNGTSFADVGPHRGIQLTNGGTTALPRDAFHNPTGASYVATVDRVFYSVEREGGGSCAGPPVGDCVLYRRQCWGELSDPAAATFPAEGSAVLRFSDTPLNCTAPGDGTDWEVIAVGIDSGVFRYLGVGGAALGPALSAADVANVRAVELDFEWVKVRPGTAGGVFRHRLLERFFLDNRDIP